MAKLIDELSDVDEVDSIAAPEAADESTVVDEPGRQQRDSAPTPGKKPNLDDDPAFRKWKSEQDKKAAALQAALDRAERERQEEKQRLAWYEQQLEQLQLRDLDPDKQKDYKIQKLERIISALNQKDQMTEARQRIYDEIRKEWQETDGIEIPVDVMAPANNADEAHFLAKRYAIAQLRKGLSTTAAERAAKREANAVDLGGGAAVTPDDDWEAEAKRLLKRKDSVGYARHILKRKYKE